MGRFLKSLIPLALAVAIGAAATRGQDGAPVPAPEDKPITATVSMVLVNVVVLDKFGFPVAGLKAPDFRVFDNGREQKVASFQETSRPMSIVLAIDSSGSTYKKMFLIKQGAVEFLRRIHETRSRDRVALVNFNDDIQLMAPFDLGWREKIAFIQDNVEAMGGTALYDAIYLTTRDVLRRTPGRKTVILYTDGIDNKSLKSYAESLRMALTSDATFFILTVDNQKQALEDAEMNYYSLSRRQYYEYMAGEAASRQGEVEPQWTSNMRAQFPVADVLSNTYRLAYQRLQRLAETSGGKFHRVSSYEELPAIYRGIASDLSYYYTVGYLPDFTHSVPGEYHSIELRLGDPALEPRYRRGYYFGEEPPKPPTR